MPFSPLDRREQVLAVDWYDRPLFPLGKIDAHRRGVFHRAFSVFLFDGAGRTLLQQRALEKYHSGGLWANSCCGHPRPDEPVKDAAQRRVYEELGLRTSLSPIFTTRYRAALDNELSENEFVHGLIGFVSQAPAPSPAEVQAVRWQSLTSLTKEIEAAPERFTAWLKHYMTHCRPALDAAARTSPSETKRQH